MNNSHTYTPKKGFPHSGDPRQAVLSQLAADPHYGESLVVCMCGYNLLAKAIYKQMRYLFFLVADGGLYVFMATPLLFRNQLIDTN